MKNKLANKWDSICSHCGLCCYEKEIIDNQTIIKMDSPCKYLDLKTNQCIVYDCRFKKEPRCEKMTLRRVLFSAYIPGSCNYKKTFSKIARTSFPVVFEYSK